MIINHNMNAMNAHRMMTANTVASGKSMEKLSSGLRINRAGDDAAGLAISEKMRAQVRGLDQASRNAQDGISLIQTAEGGLNESHSILQRMRELAVQSSNDTNVKVDRGEIQKEVDQLAQELSRIANTTEFNTQNLLGGDFEGKFHIGANEGQDITLKIGAMGAKALGVEGTAYKASDVTDVTGLQVTSKTGEALTIKFAAADTTSTAKAVDTTTAKLNTAGNEITITLKQSAGKTGVVGAITSKNDDVKAALEAIADEAGIAVSALDTFVGTTTSTVAGDTTVNVTTVDEEASKAIGINVSSQKRASASITTINKAIESVSAERSKLGAYQNRLEHTIANLNTSSENLQASESRVRDVDMAKEMMNFSKNNILAQAAQAMLAQANQQPQGVLQLLR
ncbi:flagellin [Clostridium sp. KNHs214]|uniref:flagellin N-terminal helical domain-containing protein n=1 Tax=Clostridium sp. KNHs214 TaxID=1540257 RepID=UPI0005508BB3|nr:flagellin [Clostridium sp. KNHs214]